MSLMTEWQANSKALRAMLKGLSFDDVDVVLQIISEEHSDRALRWFKGNTNITVLGSDQEFETEVEWA